MRGSITVFFSLIITMCCSLFFSMSEVIRIAELNQRAEVVTAEAVNSAFSEYQSALWETYHILGLDAGYGQDVEAIDEVVERLMEFMALNSGEDDTDGSNFYRLLTSTCNVTEYSLLTDNNAAIFKQQAASAAASLAVDGVVDYLSDSSSDSASGDEAEIDLSTSVDSAKEALKDGTITEIEGIEVETTDEEGSTEQEVEVVSMDQIDNPLEVYETLNTSSWVDLVVSDVSSKAIDTSEVVSARTLATGTATSSDSVSVIDSTLYYYYLSQVFGYCGSTKSDTALDYELEYIVAGKDNDRDNLESVVARIMAIREAANLATIYSSSTLKAQATTVATSIATAAANPELSTALEVLIIAIWALVESILDVRTLLSGGKVAAYKTSSDWTSTNLLAIAAYLPTSQKAKESETGISYITYLTGFIALLSEKNTSLRPLDLIELNLRQQEDYANLRLDHVVCAMSVDCTYEGGAVFLSFVDTTLDSLDWYSYSATKTISY